MTMGFWGFGVLGFCFGIHTCLDSFEYVCYPLVYLSMFACHWVCYSKFFDVLVCFHMLCSLLNVLAHHLWVQFSKSTLFLTQSLGGRCQ